MDSQTAGRLIRETFESAFDKERFRWFVKNLVNSIDDSAPFTYKGNYLPDAYDQYISSLERVGKYTDGRHKIDILVIKLKKETSIERARTMQRNFVAWYLNGSRGGDMKDAALAAFVSPMEEDWRFSLVKMDYRLEQDKRGRPIVKDEFTPARRWSFLVGTHENSHTAQTRLVPILADDENSPTLDRLEEAFNIESVTKEFFGKYRELFLKTKETLDEIVGRNEAIRTEFASKGVDTVDFSKKLLGQIVFLYFLQKKGWFGVARDAAWGTGPKGFLRDLFAGKHGTYSNFFNDILEPLFYEALARERDGHFYSRFNCKIPFLNGGLFDPIGGYSWYDYDKDILLPDTLFSNSNATKEGDKGDGILDIFDRYNFTVKEDEPLEKEVAVDPEMLGKVFENLLEVKDRKSKGTYYTPREIVHYMCRQSLVRYLCSGLNGGTVAYEALGEERLDLFGNTPKSGQLDLTIEHSSNPAVPISDIELLVQCGEQLGENDAAVEAKGRETARYSYKVPETIRLNARLIDEKLDSIRVCDPAVGSGAFLVGMMGEIVKIRNLLSVFIRDSNRSLYHFKRECIEKSLYGVDIDPGAVEIAKLRLWLSLVVDEDDIREIKPLPNLDYKIVCGDSLGSAPWDVWDNYLFKELESLKNGYFDETSPGKKREERSRIDALISQLTHNETRFDYHIFFSEIFDHGGKGFDVVIANPPYVRQEGIKDLKPALKKEFGSFYCGTADIYTYFYKRGVDLLCDGGHLCFIAPNKFMRAGYGKNTRELLAQKVTPLTVIDFCDLPIFDATTYPSILLVEKRRPAEETEAVVATFADEAQLQDIEGSVGECGFPMPVASLKKEGWTLERPEVLKLMEKLRAAGKPLGEYVNGKLYYGIKTGLNEAFVIDTPTRDRLIAEDPKSAELIKPWLRGRDIKKWKVEWAGLYLIYVPWHFQIQNYPAILNHLSQFRDRLENRNPSESDRYEWYALQRYGSTYYHEFEKPKIIWPGINAEVATFALDDNSFYGNDNNQLIISADFCLLAILNSQLTRFILQQICDRVQGGFYRLKMVYIEQLPIASTPDVRKPPIIDRVHRILSDPDSTDVPRLEAQIDQLVYELYGLTEDEIRIVEGAANH